MTMLRHGFGNPTEQIEKARLDFIVRYVGSWLGKRAFVRSEQHKNCSFGPIEPGMANHYNKAKLRNLEKLWKENDFNSREYLLRLVGAYVEENRLDFKVDVTLPVVDLAGQPSLQSLLEDGAKEFSKFNAKTFKEFGNSKKLDPTLATVHGHPVHGHPEVIEYNSANEYSITPDKILTAKHIREMSKFIKSRKHTPAKEAQQLKLLGEYLGKPKSEFYKVLYHPSSTFQAGQPQSPAEILYEGDVPVVRRVRTPSPEVVTQVSSAEVVAEFMKTYEMLDLDNVSKHIKLLVEASEKTAVTFEWAQPKEVFRPASPEVITSDDDDIDDPSWKEPPKIRHGTSTDTDSDRQERHMSADDSGGMSNDDILPPPSKKKKFTRHHRARLDVGTFSTDSSGPEQKQIWDPRRKVQELRGGVARRRSGEKSSEKSSFR